MLFLAVGALEARGLALLVAMRLGAAYAHLRIGALLGDVATIDVDLLALEALRDLPVLLSLVVGQVKPDALEDGFVESGLG